jgi:hypothetical protein
MDCHCGQALNLSESRDDADLATTPAQLSRNLLGPFEVAAAVGQDHQVAAGLFSGSLQLVDGDAPVAGEHRDAAQRSDGLSKSGPGDDGQDASLTGS